MRQQISFLTQSRFYSPAFNAAIFDGPLRIYFAQYQESLALKVYFNVQERLKDLYSEVKDTFRKSSTNIFVMLYPSTEAFSMSFSNMNNQDAVIVDRLGTDFVVGVRGPMIDSETSTICDRVAEVTRVMRGLKLPDALQA